jgi:uncharacterized protein (TIGR03000 family)
MSQNTQFTFDVHFPCLYHHNRGTHTAAGHGGFDTRGGTGKMYSIVLMAAVATGGPDATSFGRKGGCSGSCYGCGGGVAVASCYGSGYGSCYGSSYSYGGCSGYSAGCCGGGGRGGLFHHKSRGGCSGYSAGCTGYSCFGSGYGGGYGGCCGGGFYPSYSYSGGGCYGGGYYGGVTPTVTVPAYPGTVVPGTVVPGTTTPGTTTPIVPKAGTPDTDKDKKPPTSGMGANLKFTLPAGSKLFVDGRLVGAEGTERAFYTPDLVPGQKYFYEVKAELAVGGRTVTEEQTVIVESGANVVATFPKLVAAAAGATAVAGK